MFCCEKCGKKYTSDSIYYRKHIENCKYGEPKKYTCKICGKEFDKPGAIGGHMACEHGKGNLKENHECPICHEILFTNKGAFKNHVKNHDIEWKSKKDKNISTAKKEFYNDEERSKFAREYMSSFMKENNPMFDQEAIDKMTQSRREYIDNLSDEEYSKMVINFINAPKKGNAVNHSGKYTPTKPEQMIIDMNIQGLVYNGNKENSKTIRLENKSHKHSITPDFIYEDANKFIEVFGTYWHPKEDEEKYVKAYQENDYNILVVWETELYSNLEKTKKKILNFLDK